MKRILIIAIMFLGFACSQQSSYQHPKDRKITNLDGFYKGLIGGEFLKIDGNKGMKTIDGEGSSKEYRVYIKYDSVNKIVTLKSRGYTKRKRVMRNENGQIEFLPELGDDGRVVGMFGNLPAWTRVGVKELFDSLKYSSKSYNFYLHKKYDKYLE